MVCEEEIDRYVLPGGFVTRWYPNGLTERVDGPAYEHLLIRSDKPVEAITDPTLISKKIEVQARKIKMKPLVHGSSKDRAQRATLYNGIAQADEGTVIFDTQVCPSCGRRALKWNDSGAYCTFCGYRSS